VGREYEVTTVYDGTRYLRLSRDTSIRFSRPQQIPKLFYDVPKQEGTHFHFKSDGYERIGEAVLSQPDTLTAITFSPSEY